MEGMVVSNRTESGMLGAEVEVIEHGSSWWGVVTARYGNGEFLIRPACGGLQVVRSADEVTLIGGN